MPDAPTVYKRDRLAGRIIRRAIAAKNVADAVGTITKGCEVFGLTKGDWSLVDLIEHALSFTGPADVTLSTWTAANADIRFARNLLRDGRIKSLRFVVDFSFPSRQPAYCAALREAFGDDAIKICKSHAKFVLIRNADWSLVIRTSMNLNENRRLESFELSDDSAMADWLEEIVNQLFADQTPKQTWKRKPIEHCEAFDSQWEGEGKPATEPGTPRRKSTDEAKYFGDGPLDNDLRRAGLTYIR